jgi:MYXO-CTERM domain-containing protein
MRYRRRMASALKTISLALPLAGAALIPDEADACSPWQCAYVDLWNEVEPVNAAAKIPIDGVLLLRAAHDGGADEDELLTKLGLTVTSDGQPIAGALEPTDVRNVLAWRPADPLVPGAVYKVVGQLDNTVEGEQYDYCADDLLPLDFEFIADDGPSAPLAAPEVTAAEEVELSPGDELEDLVCCDDAFPAEYYYDCGGAGDHVGWSTGNCASLWGTGRLQVALTIDPVAPPATAQMLSVQLVVDGQPREPRIATELTSSAIQPFCTEIVLRNLATGETATSKQSCHGGAVASQLGRQLLDPSAEIASECVGAAYVCELNEDGSNWDATKCTPWPGEAATTGDETTGPTTGDETGGDQTTGGPATGGEGEDLVDHGCSCDAGTRGSFEALGLFALGLLRRRRRRRRP